MILSSPAQMIKLTSLLSITSGVADKHAYQYHQRQLLAKRKQHHKRWGIDIKTMGGWVGELYAGAGRNFLADRAERAYPRLGFIIGRRFGS